MARLLQIQSEGTIYHVTSRGHFREWEWECGRQIPPILCAAVGPW